MSDELEAALANIDWGQVVRNGGPPCFHIENGKFCLRAERWEGHNSTLDHTYVSLAKLIEEVETEGWDRLQNAVDEARERG